MGLLDAFEPRRTEQEVAPGAVAYRAVVVAPAPADVNDELHVKVDALDDGVHEYVGRWMARGDSLLPEVDDLALVQFDETGDCWVVVWWKPDNSGGGGGVSDHGALTGLADDDHPQYHNDARGDARYYTQAQITALLAGYSLSSHTHVAANITDFSAAADARIAAWVGAAPAALDTLDELAAALGDDANFAATMTTALAGKQPLDSDLTSIAGLSPLNDDVIQRKAGAWTNRTMAQVKTDLALTKSDVGLGNVDNTSDANKPVSTAQQTALDLKANLASPALTGNPTAPTQTPGTNNTRIATTAYADAIAALKASTDHDATHVRGGSDQIDGDELDIDYAASNYTPTTGTPGAHAETIAAHLRGIDNKVAELPIALSNACSVYRSAAQTHDSGSGTYDAIEFDAVEYDTNGLADLANDRITIVESGDYIVAASVGFASNATGNRFACVRVNGVDAIEHGGPAASGTTTQQPCVKVLSLVAGDDITLHGFQTSGGNLAFAVNPDLTFLSVAMVNPVQAGAPPAVKVRPSADSSIATGSSPIKVTFWSTVIYDTDSMWDSTNDQIDIPTAGVYRVGARYTMFPNTTGARILYICKNTAGTFDITKIVARISSPGMPSFEQPLSVSEDVLLAAGDHLEVYAVQNSGGSLTVAGARGEADAAFWATWVREI